MRNWGYYIVVIALISLPATSVLAAKDNVVKGKAGIIDGSTLQIGNKVMKLFGMAAPSMRQKCKRGHIPWLCGAASRKYLLELTMGKEVRCIIVDRPFARCIVGRKDLAQAMIKAGWAVVGRGGSGYRADEEEARFREVGLWRTR
ncbi:MAG: hypothetical protein HOL85_02795 [Rhodospirillaceae bacterium]|jgi:endonuclease YncB( thermonuclease family)|nr:hypothetical protein [Rhodospirillaceae bacterium]MBT6136031.1 hypothetical protein [Rhodospirillaceae bacterium]